MLVSESRVGGLDFHMSGLTSCVATSCWNDWLELDPHRGYTLTGQNRKHEDYFRSIISGGNV